MTPVIVTGLEPVRVNVAALVDSIRRPDCGGLVVFEGTTRSPSEGREVLRLEYEVWEQRARRQLREIAERTAAEFGLGGAVAVHRVGVVPIGETSVVCAAAAPHRPEAFAAGRALIDRVKAECAIWKKEFFAGGEAWAGLGGRE